MRVKSSEKLHKMKRDPYKSLIRFTLITLGVMALAGLVFYLCALAVNNDYIAKRKEVEQANIEGQQQFDVWLNNQIAAQQSGGTTQRAVDPQEKTVWEANLDGATWRVEDQGNLALENTTTIQMERAALVNGCLLLVNPWHALPSDFSDVDLVSVGAASGYKIQVHNNSVRLFPIAYDALAKMIEDASAAGLEYYIVREAYRTNDTQTELFNKAMEELADKYSGDILIAQAKKEVNYPGTSEYQTGLSFQMGLYNKEEPIKGGFQESDQGKWFTENCWKYGVILRFPTADFPNSSWEDKSYKTGVSLKLNLYRYVTKPHAVAMKVLNYCLEEYVEYLISHPHLLIYEDGALKYEVFRVPVEDGLASYDLPKPNPASDYNASFDNMGGIVLTYSY